MTKNTYRFIILLLTALLFLVIWWGVSFSQNNNQEIELPDAIENIYPLPYDQVPQQVSLEIDFPVGYKLTLIVDNYIIPEEIRLNVILENGSDLTLSIPLIEHHTGYKANFDKVHFSNHYIEIQKYRFIAL